MKREIGENITKNNRVFKGWFMAGVKSIGEGETSHRRGDQKKEGN